MALPFASMADFCGTIDPDNGCQHPRKLLVLHKEHDSSPGNIKNVTNPAWYRPRVLSHRFRCRRFQRNCQCCVYLSTNVHTWHRIRLVSPPVPRSDPSRHPLSMPTAVLYHGLPLRDPSAQPLTRSRPTRSPNERSCSGRTSWAQCPSGRRTSHRFGSDSQPHLPRQPQ